MYAVSKSEVLHCGERGAEQIGNAGRGRYLPVKVTADDSYGKGICLGLLMRIHLQINFPASELEFGTLEPAVLCSVYKLQESWHRERELVEDVDL